MMHGNSGAHHLDLLRIPTLMTWLTWLGSASAAHITDSRDELVSGFNVGSLLAVVVGAVVFCIVVVVLLSQCTDCYSAEVATDTHAACGASKNYEAPDDTFTTSPPRNYSGYAPVANNSVPLPYTLNPEPSSPQASAPPIGPSGLGSNQWGATQQPMPQGYPAYGAGAQPQQQAGRHYAGPEQPPTYNEAVRGVHR